MIAARSLLLLLTCLFWLGCSKQETTAPRGEPAGSVGSRARPTRQLRIGVAASLRPAFERLQAEFLVRHPSVEVQLETGGSNALCRKALELGISFDLLALADASLFDALLKPDWTEHHVRLATNRLVLAHSPHAEPVAGPHRIAAILLKKSVRLGMADPSRAPLGYRTRRGIKLLERSSGPIGLEQQLLGKIGKRFVWPNAAALLVQLELGEIDYGFLYAASATTAGLKFTEMPPEANLGSPSHDYSGVSVKIVGMTPESELVRTGALIVYGVALAKSTKQRESGAQFMALLMGAEGTRALESAGFRSLESSPSRVVGTLPQEITVALSAEGAKTKK